jgi:glucose/arabinose dehydrogenase
MAVETAPQDQPSAVDGGVIDDGRGRQRRRRGAAAVILLVAATIGLIAYVALGGPNGGAQRTNPAGRGDATSAIGVSLKAPHGLAVARDGALYVVDTGRDQVLRRLRSGVFEVVAGNGRRGFSGDGGRAANAELNLANDSGIVVADNGTLYIADSGNGRVRAVSAGGVIHTVAGDGKPSAGRKVSLHHTPALDASLGEVAGLAIGPNGDLYVAAGNVVRITSA